MPTASADRNLLFGILAVQMDFVTSQQLVSGMNSWVLDKSRSLGAHLNEIGALAAETHALIEALVDKHIEQHGGRVDQSLAAVGSGALQHGLSSIADADVQSSLGHAAAAATPRNDRHATIAFSKPRAADETERFHILRPHAAGGLGKVSVARDAELNREVALKELHDRHADNLDSRARFLQEAEITGGLEHPGVVPIYALGHYADGRPYYAMRFIRGDSLAQAIERFHREADVNWKAAADVLQLRRLLGRFLDVCNAIDYAHSRGVLHRDLKPGNIMLGQYGETLVVDWGLAKPIGVHGETTPRPADATVPHSHEPALTPQSGSGSAPTQMGSAIGTPAYMSPEQAAGRLDQLGPTSDVYSLGATLYTLLTGRAAQEDDDLGIVLQRVQRGEFPTPRAIKAAIPKGLEAICLKAMALQPRDRYPSARKLADDVEAWLADEPITARPDSVRAKAFRWIKHHRTLVTSGAAMVLVALVALSAGTVRLRIANEREREAANDAVLAQKKAEAAQAEAERQTARNEELVELARKSLGRYETLSQSEVLRRYGMEPLRRELLEVALDFYATLARQVGESEQARSDRGDALYRLGWTYSQLGSIDQAMSAFDQGLELFKPLAEEFPKEPYYPRSVATLLVSKAELMNNARNTAASEASLAEARQRVEAMRLNDPADVDAVTRLAYINSLDGERLRQTGKLEEAVTRFREGFELLHSIDLDALENSQRFDVQYRIGRALNQLASLESQALWRFDEGRKYFDQAEAVLGKLFEEQPTWGDVGFSLAQVLRNSGDLYARTHHYEPAKKAYERSLEVTSAIEQQNPNTPHYREEKAEILHSLGALHRAHESGNMTPEGLARLEEAVAIGTQLVEQSPDDVSNRLALARFQSTLGEAYVLRDRGEEGDRSFNASLDSLKVATEQAGENLDVLYTLGELQYTIAEQLGDVSRNAESLEMLDESEKSLQKLISLSPGFGEAYLSLWNVLIERSICFANEDLIVDSLAQLERMNAMGDTMKQLSEAPWMKGAAQAVTTLGRSLRLGRLVQIRNGEINVLSDGGHYELAGDQARKFPELTGEESDHYVAARALAYAATAANGDKELADDKRGSLVEPLAADAVKQLTLAWQKGYLRRRNSSFGFLRSNPDLGDLADVAEFDILEDRGDYRELLKRIESEEARR